MKVEKVLQQLQRAIQSRASRSVFLGVREQGTRLSFGLNQTNLVEYAISLRWAGGEAEFDSSDPHQVECALMLDQPAPDSPLRLAIWGEGQKAEPFLVYDGKEPDCPPLWGEILIVATSPNGKDHAVISAAFDGAGHDSIFRDGAPATARHLQMLNDLYQREAFPPPIEEDGEEADYEPYGLAESAPFLSR